MLFDGGETHNFMSIDFSFQIGFFIMELEVLLNVTTTKGSLHCIIP